MVLTSLALALGVGGGLVLCLPVRAEHGNRGILERHEAERAARRDSDEQRR